MHKGLILLLRTEASRGGGIDARFPVRFKAHLARQQLEGVNSVHKSILEHLVYYGKRETVE